MRTIPPGVGAPIGQYTVWATWACPQDAQGNAAGCFTSPIVTLQAVCWGPFKQCVGSGTPALLDPSPVAVPLQKICAKNAPTVCYYNFDVAARVKLIDASGKPVAGASIDLDLGNVAGAPFSIGGSGKTDSAGIATLKASFSFDPRGAKTSFDKGSRFAGTAKYGKFSLAINFVVQ